MSMLLAADAYAVAGIESAERQLWCAVIERALHDAMNGVPIVIRSTEQQRICDDARFWFERNSKQFRSTCELAGFDPDYLRARVLPLIVVDAKA